MVFLLLFFIGLFIGSFLNVVIDRLPRKENFFVGRSHCDYCQHSLAWYDLFPLFSFLFLHGKCRYCHTFIGWKYPVIEATTGILFAVTALFIPVNQSFIFLLSLGIVCGLIIIFFTDLFSGIIPDAILVYLIILQCIKFFASPQTILSSLLSSLGAGLFFLVLYLLTKQKGIGFGDVKYAFVMGLLLGYPGIIPGLYVAFLTGAAIAFILLLAKKKRFGSSIPFGPFLVFGTVTYFFAGISLWTYFLHLLGM